MTYIDERSLQATMLPSDGVSAASDVGGADGAEAETTAVEWFAFLKLNTDISPISVEMMPRCG
ncbi:hypothetical protein [Agrobacterium vitis]|uniref:hypothetical protein n=1 Tax=Agrobacterium vitis TaxID=373 RepID=UPI0018D1FCA2|nr:hypothetical protein [Agrobacterium vitis]